MLFGLLVVVHIIASILLIVTILMQSAKGEGLSGAFGMGSGTSSFFGADTATVLTKTTAVLAIIFMITCITIAYILKEKGKSVAGGPTVPISAGTAREGMGESEKAGTAEAEEPVKEESTTLPEESGEVNEEPVKKDETESGKEKEGSDKESTSSTENPPG